VTDEIAGEIWDIEDEMAELAAAGDIPGRVVYLLPRN
jgi:hypothetical protein